MTKEQKIDKLLEVYCGKISIPRGEAYEVAFGSLDNLSQEELNSKLDEQIILTDAMTDLGLIRLYDRYDVYYKATPYGREIQENGGWTKHLELKFNKENQDRTKGNLEYENLRLQNDTLRNELRDRKNKEEINKLTIENLKLQNRNNKVWFIIIGAVLTYLIGNWKEIWNSIVLLKSE